MTKVEAMLLVMILALAAVLGVILYKSVRIHLLVQKLAGESELTGKEVASVYRQIEALNGLDKLLGLTSPLPPLRGWAGSPDFLLLLVEHVLQAKPKCVLECSSGSSTIVMACALRKIGVGHVYSLEHSSTYAAQTRGNLMKHGLESWATVLEAPLEPKAEFDGALWYSLKELPSVKGAVDMLVIDGPPQSTARLARLPALPALAHKMIQDCVVFLDDSDRPPEQEIVAMWLKQFPHLQQEQMWCEKGCAKLSRMQV